MEEGNDGTFKFRSYLKILLVLHVYNKLDSARLDATSTSVDRGRGECLPDNAFTNVGGNEERNTRSETVAFLK